jgi:cyclohexa-1,5-dienecarbonyl-CoA hydratase
VRSEELEAGRILRLSLDAGKGNVLGREALGELREALTLLGTAPGRCAIVLDHEGRDFSWGASVPEHAPGEVHGMLRRLHELAAELLALQVPLLAAARGLCLGGGLELALLADRLFLAPGARLGQPEVLLGVFAPIGSALLPRLIGPRPAAELLLSGRQLDAQEALRLGLAAAIAEDPGAAALAWAREHLCAKSAAALRQATRAARRAWAPGFLADLAALEAQYLDELMLTHDAREGIQAFLERRPPRWEDR